MIDSQQIINEIKYLSNDRIWKTKKARMEAEERLNKYNFLSNLLVNYYTFFVLAFSIWTLISEDTDISLLTVIASVGLFGVSLFLSYVGFREKAIQFKDSYQRLDELDIDVKSLLRKSNTITVEELINILNSYEKKYNEIISKTDNHSSIDYQKLAISRKLDGYKDLRLNYYLTSLGVNLFILFLFVSPILLFLYFLYY
jgi:hypothetical protein